MDKLKKPQIAVRAFITNSTGGVLIVQRANTAYGNGLWNLPGGKIDFGETAEESVKKEIFEETSLNCKSAKFLFYMDNLPDETTNLHIVALFFECKCTGDIKTNRESSDFKWINKNPEVVTDKGGYGYYEDKPYFNVLFEDKASFNPNTEWEDVYYFFRYKDSKFLAFLYKIKRLFKNGI